MFEPLLNLAKRGQELNLNFIMQELFKDKEVTDLIIKLNTQSQLYDKGIDSDGRRLISPHRFGPYAYARSTVFGTATYDGKIAKHQVVDRVTLKDTGDFYRSFKIYLDSNNDFEIKADSVKDGIDILLQWGTDVLGLTEDSQSIFNELVKKKVPDITLNFMLKAA